MRTTQLLFDKRSVTFQTCRNLMASEIGALEHGFPVRRVRHINRRIHPKDRDALVASRFFDVDPS